MISLQMGFRFAKTCQRCDFLNQDATGTDFLNKDGATTAISTRFRPAAFNFQRKILASTLFLLEKQRQHPDLIDNTLTLLAKASATAPNSIPLRIFSDVH